MYKYYDKGSYEIMEYSFDSIHEFLDYLDKSKISKAFEDKILESISGDNDFCKTKSFEEAKELCKYGYHENFDKFRELKIKLEKYVKISNQRSKPYNYYAGYAPDVKSYLEGNPLSMINKQNPKRKHIDIYYNSSVSWLINEGQIFNRGVITLCLVEMLESLGYSVGLNVFTMSRKNNQIFYSKFNLKRPEEKLNIKKLYFPMCHPSFLRRLVFRLKEVTPDITYDWTRGYGSPCDDVTIRKIIDLKGNDIVICGPSEMDIGGYDIVKDADAMISYINNFSSENIVLSPTQKVRRI